MTGPARRYPKVIVFLNSFSFSLAVDKEKRDSLDVVEKKLNVCHHVSEMECELRLVS